MMKYIKQVIITFSLMLLLSGSFTSSVWAATYGSGTYGGGRYGEKSLTPAGSPQCNDTKPNSAPWLYTATTKSTSSILLQFTQVESNVNKYAIEYGLESGNYIYATDNIGDANTTEYLVKDLQPNTTYFFRVRAGNGCATGDWSSEISATTKGGMGYSNHKQLDIIDTKLEPVVSTPAETGCSIYTVNSGDTLWNIAQNELGDGSLYTKIVEDNKEKYPSLADSNSLSSGWDLQICPSQAESAEEGKQGYTVNVKVLDAKQKPVEGAHVTIHSEVQEATTNSDGIARFDNVEAGDHKILIAYRGYTGEQGINLSGEVKEFNLNITIQQKNIFTSPKVLAVIGGLSLVIIILVVLLIKSRRSRR